MQNGQSDADHITLTPTGLFGEQLVIERNGQIFSVNGYSLKLGEKHSRFYWRLSRCLWVILTADLSLENRGFAEPFQPDSLNNHDTLYLSGDVRCLMLNPLGPGLVIAGLLLLIQGQWGGVGRKGLLRRTSEKRRA